MELQQNADFAQSAWDHPVDAHLPASHSLWLGQNGPNPFNPTTRITFSLAAAAPADLVVYAANGKRVRTLLHGSPSPGTHDLVWDGRDDAGRRVPSGTYFYRLTVNEDCITRKMQLLK